MGPALEGQTWCYGLQHHCIFLADYWSTIFVGDMVDGHICTRMNLLPLLTPYGVIGFCQHWFRLWLVTCLATSHNLNQCWIIIMWTHLYKFKWNFIWNWNIFIEETAFKNVVCKTAAILFWPQCAKNIFKFVKFITDINNRISEDSARCLEACSNSLGDVDSIINYQISNWYLGCRYLEHFLWNCLPVNAKKTH